MEFIIQDWAGNVKFNGKTFKSLEAGFAFLQSKFSNDEELGEFYVVPLEVK